MKIIFFILCFFCYGGSSVFAVGESVQDVFYDVDEGYEYKDELQTLYDKGMIIPDISGSFGAENFLNRDEFVGVALEVVCERCIQPHTDFETIEKYFDEKVYFDLDNRNPYFYCIAEANTKNSIRGYDIGETCQNGDSKFGERPFCPANRINLEEAVAVLLRNSGIYTIDQNRETIRNINAGIMYQKVANDVSPKNSDGSAYTFYGYLQKALEYEILEYDTDGNATTRKLLEPDEQGNVYPKKQITKEQFLKMSYVVLKTNSCVTENNDTIAGVIDIKNASCRIDQDNCPLSELDDIGNTYDFSVRSNGFCADGIDARTGYSWRFHNLSTGEEFFEYGQYIDDTTLSSVGEWKVSLHSKDRCGNTGQVHATVIVDEIDERTLSPNGLRDPENRNTSFIKIYDGDCVGTGACSELTPGELIGGDSLYDFVIDNPSIDPSIPASNYNWTFTNIDTGKIDQYTGKKLNDISIPENQKWKVALQIQDANGDIITEYNTSISSPTNKNINAQSNIGVNILLDELSGTTDFVGKFSVQVNGGTPPYIYSWNFGDGERGTGKNIEHIYTNPGTYKVELTVGDDDQNISSASVIVNVLDGDSCEQDSDSDGIFDCEDLCPIISGDSQNSGCPIFEQKCDQTCGCKAGYTCDDSNTLTCGVSGICKPEVSTVKESCLYNAKQGGIFGNTLCTTCPCNSSLDFLSDVRRCDILFPAITSPDGTEIYSQGKLWEVQ